MIEDSKSLFVNDLITNNDKDKIDKLRLMQ